MKPQTRKHYKKEARSLERLDSKDELNEQVKELESQEPTRYVISLSGEPNKGPWLSPKTGGVYEAPTLKEAQVKTDRALMNTWLEVSVKEKYPNAKIVPLRPKKLGQLEREVLFHAALYITHPHSSILVDLEDAVYDLEDYKKGKCLPRIRCF